jgi:hypothetical protein
MAGLNLLEACTVVSLQPIIEVTVVANHDTGIQYLL